VSPSIPPSAAKKFTQDACGFYDIWPSLILTGPFLENRTPEEQVAFYRPPEALRNRLILA
jgi:hypothetical protein